MARNIVIYQDEGVGEFGLKCLCEFFSNDEVWFANAEAIIDGRVLGMADIFVMPGGADLPYCRKLNGEGNDNIRAYVEEGGTYLGICAGAYYGCSKIEWHKGRSDEICEPRELAFAPVTAIGSLHDLAAPYDETLNSAAIVMLTGGQQAFYNGGCTFRGKGGFEVLARYEGLPLKPPAIISVEVGEGRAILSGIHFEMTPALLKNHPAEGFEAKLASLIAGFTMPVNTDFLKDIG